jgi:hypothetical protein
VYTAFMSLTYLTCMVFRIARQIIGAEQQDRNGGARLAMNFARDFACLAMEMPTLPKRSCSARVASPFLDRYPVPKRIVTATLTIENKGPSRDPQKDRQT